MLSDSESGSGPQTSHEASLKSSGSPSDSHTTFGGSGPLGGGVTVDQCSPRNSAGTAMTNPAIGPAMPMSNSADLLKIGWRIRITAPNVPVRMNGAGRKKGSVASMP